MLAKRDFVPEALISLAELYRDRHRDYGDSDKTFGHVFKALFPDGIEVRTISDANRMALFFHVVDKLVRYANNFSKGGHDDSLKDISVYATMLRERDDELRNGATD